MRLLDRGFFRVGGEDYAEENETYGLATIRKSHVTLGDDTIELDYPAKSGQRRVQSIVDSRGPRDRGGAEAAPRRRPGAAGSPRRAALGRRQVTRHQRVREGGHRRRLLRQGLPHLERHGAGRRRTGGLRADGRESATARRCARVKEVARYLGNTPAVSRASYIDPRVFDRFDSGVTIGGALSDLAETGDIAALHGPVEEAVLDLIAEEESPTIEKVA